MANNANTNSRTIDWWRLSVVEIAARIMKLQANDCDCSINHSLTLSISSNFYAIVLSREIV